MPSIPEYLVGQNASMFSLTPQTVGANGVLSAGTVGSLLGVWDSFAYQGDDGLVDIHNAGARIKNYTPTAADFRATMTALQRASGGSLLRDNAFAGKYYAVSVQATTPDGTVGGLLVLYGVLETFDTQMVEQKNTETMVLRPCGIPTVWTPGS